MQEKPFVRALALSPAPGRPTDQELENPVMRVKSHPLESPIH